MEQLSAIDESEYQVQLFGRLERKLEGDNEWAIDFGEYGPLGQGMGDFRPRDNVGFPDGLEGIDSEGVAFTNLHDLIVSLDLGMDLPFRMILFRLL
jgi:hypothetical protein